MNRFSMFGSGCSVPETLSTNITWIVTCTTAMFALDVIFQDMFLVECAATNVTFILLNSTGVVGFLTNFHVSGERSFICISFVALLTNKLPDFVLRTYVPCVVSLFHNGFLTNFAFPFLFVLVVHIVTPQTTEADENLSTN